MSVARSIDDTRIGTADWDGVVQLADMGVDAGLASIERLKAKW